MATFKVFSVWLGSHEFKWVEQTVGFLSNAEHMHCILYSMYINYIGKIIHFIGKFTYRCGHMQTQYIPRTAVGYRGLNPN